MNADEKRAWVSKRRTLLHDLIKAADAYRAVRALLS